MGRRKNAISGGRSHHSRCQREGEIHGIDSKFGGFGRKGLEARGKSQNYGSARDLRLSSGSGRCFTATVPQTTTWIRNWLKACGEISNYPDIPGYRGLSWAARKKLDHQALCMLVRRKSFWRATFVVLAAISLAHILTWRFDLIGWQRDVLRCLPIVLAAPWMAAMRRRLIQQLLND